MYPTKDLIVTLTNKQEIKGVGRCHKVFVQLQNLELETKFHALPLSGMDEVLGIEWLIQCGNRCHKSQRTVHGI